MIQQRKKSERKRRLTSDELVFQPWFLSSDIANEIRVLIPPGYQRKMRDYFDNFGCMSCHRADRLYGGNGMCHLCETKIRTRIRKCIQRRLDGSVEIVQPDLFMKEPNKVKKLLRGIELGKSKTKTRSRKGRGHLNPALDVYRSLTDSRRSVPVIPPLGDPVDSKSAL